MRLESFTVRNYRSITNARKISVGDYTTLVGPNNEGKSNILKALRLAMDTLNRYAHYRAIDPSKAQLLISNMIRSRDYDWQSDYPLSLQEKQPGDSSTITLDFRLTENEVQLFQKEIGSSVNGLLPITLTFSARHTSLQVRKQGKAHTKFDRDRLLIAHFATERLQFLYIPAVRTAKDAQNIISRLVENMLAELEDNADYKSALTRIEAIQKPYLDNISNSIAGTVREFLPAVANITISIGTRERFRSLRSATEITVDDGVATPLERKGDGVQSLVALAVIRHASKKLSEAQELILGLEEPESHLHPRAIHELKSVLNELSARSQVLLTTHNPLFANRAAVGQNIIVTDGQASPANRISEIREALGVKVSDNLTNAGVVLLVEGKSDEQVIRAYFAKSTDTIQNALKDGRLAIESIDGAPKLPYTLRLHLANIAQVHVFLDADPEGRRAMESARSDRLISDPDVNFTIVSGLENSELEDLYNTDLIFNQVFDSYHVKPNKTEWKQKKLESKHGSRLYSEWKRLVETSTRRFKVGFLIGS